MTDQQENGNTDHFPYSRIQDQPEIAIEAERDKIEFSTRKSHRHMKGAIGCLFVISVFVTVIAIAFITQ